MLVKIFQKSAHASIFILLAVSCESCGLFDKENSKGESQLLVSENLSPLNQNTIDTNAVFQELLDKIKYSDSSDVSNHLFMIDHYDSTKKSYMISDGQIVNGNYVISSWWYFYPESKRKFVPLLEDK